MEFNAFQKSKYDRYAEEVRERWGSTKSYEESIQKMKGKAAQETDAAAEEDDGAFCRNRRSPWLQT